MAPFETNNDELVRASKLPVFKFLFQFNSTMEIQRKEAGEQGWRSNESTFLPPMWPGFASRTRRHIWVEFVVGSRPCSERFITGYTGFPLSSNQHF